MLDFKQFYPAPGSMLRESKKHSRFIKFLFTFFFFVTIFFVLHSSVYAATYYVDQTGGNDGNTGTATGQAWKTISKVNGFTFASGDTISFKRGEVWRETLTVPRDNLIINDYGSGALPLIKGSDAFGTWTAVPAPFFYDDFESGNLNKWTTDNSNGTTTVSTAQKFEGNDSAKLSVTTAGGHARLKSSAISVGNNGDVWMTARMYLDAGYSTTGNTTVFQITEANSPWNTMVLEILNNNQIGIWDPISSQWYQSSATVPTGSWFSLRFHITAVRRSLDR